ncbi:MAG: putative Fe-S protein [Phormidesmis priestleyi Ana]|uniref:Putative Fe-S protein n=1 Tax=Phormidesmis priestleyi Ana TaxID=1666911 RepID=A0A0P8DER0_9CYAN|nr:MAG: putative Fe-S protein [Phormidesmis priestleyi Ana]
MARTLVGHLKALWRYPVKSMQGETLEISEVGEQGLVGDRTYALWDVKTSRVASAKNPQKWATLLNCQATFTKTPTLSEPMPPVQITLPMGTTVTSTQPDINPLLSDWIEREVQFLSSAPAKPSLDQYWPDVEGREYRDTVVELLMPEGTFFDSCPIHAVTVATLERLKALYPTGEFDPCRFRPNLLIDTQADQPDFVENDWIGKTLLIGDSVILKIDTKCPRCVVTTLAQNGLPQDLDILRTTAKYNEVIAGIRLSVIQGGTIHQGDAVWLETTNA